MHPDQIDWNWRFLPLLSWQAAQRQPMHIFIGGNGSKNPHHVQHFISANLYEDENDDIDDRADEAQRDATMCVLASLHPKYSEL